MVIDAHKVAQQLTSSQLLEKNDPRRLLAKLHPLDDQLRDVAFNDITWDSEGVAAQSLELELQDLEERANAWHLCNMCVLVSAATASDGTSDQSEAALIWIPKASNTANNASKKYLLYVVPGRIKIVKSTEELVKKMMEEIPTLRLPGATYRIWSLIQGKNVSMETQSRSLNNTPLVTKTQPRALASTADMNSNCKREESPEIDVDTTKESAVEIRAASEVRPLRVRAHQQDATPRPSIFSFPRVNAELSRDQPAQDVLSSPTKIESEPTSPPAMFPSSESNGKPSALRSSSQIAVEPVVCASPATSCKRGEKRVGCPGVSVSQVHPRKGHYRAHYDGVSGWNSLDGKCRNIVQGRTHDNSDQLTANASIAVTEATRRSSGFRVQPVAQREISDSIFQFTSSSKLEHPSPPMDLSPKKAVHQDDSQLSASCGMKGLDGSDTTPTNNNHLNQSDSNEPAESVISQKKRSARDHYRSKLGARGWWELEYQVNKILEQDHQQQRDPLFASGSGAKPHGRQWVDKSEPQSAAQGRERTKCPHSSARPDCTSQESRPAATKQDAELEVLPASKSASSSQASREPIHTNELPDKGLESRWVAAVGGSAEALSHHSEAPDCVKWPCKSDEHHGSEVPPVKSPYPDPLIAMEASKHSPGSREGTRWATAQTKTSLVEQQQEVRTSRDIQTNGRTSTVSSTTRGAQSEAFGNSKHLFDRSQKAVPPNRLSIVTQPEMSFVDQKVASETAFDAVQFQKPTWTTGDDENDAVLMGTMVFHDRTPPQKNFVAIGDHNGNDMHGREEITHKPFNNYGRVPIRQRQAGKPRPREVLVASDDESGDESDRRTGEMASHSPVRKPQEEALNPRSQLIAEPFTVGSPVKSHDEATQLARQQKLAELRQKKIEQLQKARKEVIGKKQPQPSQLQPKNIPASVVIDAKLDPNPNKGKQIAPPSTVPPPSNAVGAGESFAMHGTSGLARVRKPSNRKLIQNAIEYTLLAGGSLDKERQAAVQALAESSCDNFVVLLKSAKELKFRGLYEHHIERGRVVRIFSIASSCPPVLTDDVISQFFRYNSGKKEFTAIDSREFTVKTDACALVDQLVFKKKNLHRIL